MLVAGPSQGQAVPGLFRDFKSCSIPLGGPTSEICSLALLEQRFSTFLTP